MAPNVEIRNGTSDDYSAALELYLSAMRPLTEALMIWDDAKQRESFAAQWILDEVQIVAVNGIDVGWLQIAETSTETRLRQFFISPEYRRAGIGTEVLHCLTKVWAVVNKPVTLEVLKNNPARSLYERFAFSVVGETGVKFLMRRGATISATPEIA